MNKITESEIETFAIDLLESSGYDYIYGPDIAPDSETPERLQTAHKSVAIWSGWLVDFQNPDNNDFVVCNQFTVISASSVPGTVNKRPDVVLFVNGLP
jgi:hypothetical protein